MWTMLATSFMLHLCWFVLFMAHVAFNSHGDDSDSVQTTSDYFDFCGEGMFICMEPKAAYLHLNGATIPYVPTLPGFISDVDLSDAMPVSVPDNFFSNLTSIQTLKIGTASLMYLTHKAFTGMVKLRRLILSHSLHLTTHSLLAVFSIPCLDSIELEFCNFSPAMYETGYRDNWLQNGTAKDRFPNVPQESFPDSLFISAVSHIDCDHNPWGDVDHLDAFCGLSSLSNLSCRYCNIQSMGGSCPLEKLSTLDLSYNSLSYFPDTCKPETNESVFPMLTALYLRRNQIYGLGTELRNLCLPSLTHLDLSDNVLAFFPSFTFGPSNFPLLKVLELQNQRSWDLKKIQKLDKHFLRSLILPHEVQEHAFSNGNLEELDLSNSRLKFGNKGDISKSAFTNCSSLRLFNLNLNNFTSVDDRRFLELFGHLHSLVKLSLSGCSFQSLTTRTFANFHNLTVLNLDSNMITELPNKAFDSLHRLKSLHLHRNKIRGIGDRAFSQHLHKNLTSLTLGFNPFHCSCNLRWFAAWYQTEQQNLFTDATSIHNYQCDNLNGLPLRNFSLVDQACLLSHETHLLVIEFCSLFIVILMLSLLLFRFRWHVRLLVYDVFRGRENLRRQRLRQNHFNYDVFVSYDSDDMPWVHEHLMPKMEDELGLRLCLHERDFTPGHHIVDNIARCVDSSKKVLMVFSEGFVHSQWCQFELAYCLTHVLDYDEAMLVVCVDDVTSRQMTSSMRAVLRTMTYIQWREGDEDATASFWGRLLQGLHEILPHNEHLV